MTGPWEVLVISSEEENRESVVGILARQGIDTVCASTLGQFEQILKRRDIGLVFCDPRCPDGSYLDILTRVRRSVRTTPKVVVMAADMSPEERHQAKLCGAFDVIPIPCRPHYVEWMVVLAKRAWPLRGKDLEGASIGRPLTEVRGS
jgi:DNA-binding NtrC family response regulator